MSEKPVNRQTEEALRLLESTALSFAYQFINISQVRSEYIRRSLELSSSLRAAYRGGEMSAKAAAEAAHGMRNQILDLQRGRSAAVGRALAEQMKKSGRTMEELLGRYSQEYFKKPFSQLDNVQQTRVYMEIVDAAGRPQVRANRLAARAGAAGRALFLLGIGIAAYNIANAQDPAWQTGRETANIAGGLGGSIAAGALAGIWLGPVGVAIGAFVGGVAGALLADQAYVEVAGPSDRSVAGFINRFANLMSTDERGMADAMFREFGMDVDRAHSVFLALEESYTSDADDVALYYLQHIFVGGGNVLEALRLNQRFRLTLIRILDDGWTSGEEKRMISQLQAMW